MGAAILHLIVAQQQAACGVAGRRVRLPDEEWTRLVEGQVPCGRGCAGTQMGTPGKLGGLHTVVHSSQGPPTRTCAVNAAAERDPAPVLSRYRRPATAYREASTWLPTQGRRRLDFLLPISAA
ncbi:hypothetical protein CesoFtcFv8_023287 [Champsocephalus esox]|uniref:Uncharacterized protein n=2 Tax=Champsocephalus TaxID=52236 RepID=A0AAN8CGC4_CHAGU|nr:hypothetical protein CesoFtcFv8_023287 [Champsocephalus esox]KAK5903631.1 hypothetical protein CgunFtcFv8_007392 [Champsocephalus gunnari]